MDRDPAELNAVRERKDLYWTYIRYKLLLILRPPKVRIPWCSAVFQQF